MNHFTKMKYLLGRSISGNFLIYPTLVLSSLLLLISCGIQSSKKSNHLLFSLDFEEQNSTLFSDNPSNHPEFCNGINGNGLDLGNSTINCRVRDCDTSWFSNCNDFSISVWVKSVNQTADTTIIFSNSDFRKKDAGIYGNRRIHNGFTLYSHNGAWGWNLGNGNQHFLYEPITEDQPIADNQWHQLVFTYNSILKEVRLFYDGLNKAVIHTGDLDERYFISDLPLRIGNQNNGTQPYRSFQGIIDEFQVWGITLSPRNIKNEFEKYSRASEEAEMETDFLTVVNWNIWHGGTHFLKDKDGFDGIERITKLIRDAGADIVLMQETYGAGSRISSSLGFYYYEAGSTIGAVWGANLSVMSRFPFEDAYMVETQSNYGNNYAFNNGGVKIRLSKHKSVIAFSNWYNGRKPEDLDSALTAWPGLINHSDEVPVIFGGDFNSISHLDDDKGKSGHSKLMANAGFIDSYRHIHPDILRYPGYSNGGNSARIDYIYFKGKGLELVEAIPIVPNFMGKELNTPGYPSEHLGIVAKFRVIHK